MPILLRLNKLWIILIVCIYTVWTPEIFAAAKWEKHEISLTAQKFYDNPYTDVSVTASFHGPGDYCSEVKGFWDGGKTFKVRFTPPRTGNWTYSISSSPADSGLTKSGSFEVTGKVPGRHGFVRRDPAFPYSFRFDDGTRYFMMGNTYYSIVENALAGDNWKAAIKGSAIHGINKIRMLIFPWGKTKYPYSEPFMGDHDHLNLRHWQKLDEIIEFLNNRSMVADIILFADDPDHYGTLSQDKRYVRYALARFAAYPNVIWCLCNEWNYSPKPKSYWNDMGQLVRSEDPWMNNGGALRPLSIHQQTRYDFQFFDSEWPDYATIQVGVRNNRPRLTQGDEWGNYGIIHNLGHKMPVVNDEYGYMYGPDVEIRGSRSFLSRSKHRNALWGIFIGGGAGASAGDARRSASVFAKGSAIWNCGDWKDAPEYNDIKILVDFWTAQGIEYWKMASRNDLIEHGNRVYVLARVGQEYIVYDADGGKFRIRLEKGRTYEAVRFNPRDGKKTRMEIVPGGSEQFCAPPGKDWVFNIVAHSS
jgi:Domain of unknown function (DUF5060)/Protein of unknown function (DUF4038)/Putative collagen-binding domain of a collagenase